MKLGVLAVGVAVLILVMMSAAFATIPTTISYQGYLTDAGGNPVNTTVAVVFSLYSTATGGTALWSEAHNVTAVNGVYSVILGNSNLVPVPINLPFDQQYYLGIRVGSDFEMTPRQALTSVPYAQKAKTVETIGSHTHAGNEITGNIPGSAVNVTGTVAVANGGTGATDASGARLNLGLGALATIGAVSGGAGGTITDGTITNADVSASAGISDSKLATISTAGKVSDTALSSKVVLTDNVQTISGAKTFSSNITGPQIVSTVSTGTSPLQVASTTMVSNFNAEMVGGYRASQLVPAAQMQTPRANTITTVDDPANKVGEYTSITIGTDGLPVISYQDVYASALKVAKCGNASCSSGNTINTVDDPANNVGRYTSITIGTDGYPVISYMDYTAKALKVAKCGDAACSSGNTINTVDGPSVSGNIVGYYTSITIGRDGYPVISYQDDTAGALKVAKCGDASCSSGNVITTVNDPANSVGWYTSITIGMDGYPVISYQDYTAWALKVAKCGDAACSAGNIITTVDDPANNVGQYTSITIGTDGLPVISYHDEHFRALKVAKCVNAACTGVSTITTVDAPGGEYASITIGTDGLPVISYYDEIAQALKVAKCGNAACTGVSTITTVDAPGYRVGLYTSITIGTDGLPVISYMDYKALTLKVVKCANHFCINNWTRR